jgi:hypothetical protein
MKKQIMKIKSKLIKIIKGANLNYLALECVNRLSYGRNAPRPYELIWIKPSSCNSAVHNCAGELADLGSTIKGGIWDKDLIPVNECPNVMFSNLRWQENIPWDQTGSTKYTLDYINKNGSFDGYKTKHHIDKRHANLDDIFAQVQFEKKLRLQHQIDEIYFRERNGILIHIDRNCRPVFGRAGEHRFAIARILNLPIIPAQLGVIHPEALLHWRRVFLAFNPPSMFDYFGYNFRKLRSGIQTGLNDGNDLEKKN